MSYSVDDNDNLMQLPPAKLPIFKDKVMYIGANQNKYKIEQSYVISASYNGILRLSPNNYNTIFEHNPVELSTEQDESISSSYSDAIVFDDAAINNTKTNADITRRMIICSDSDGYLVNFRLSDKHIEFDNLGVIGIAKTSKLTLYTNDKASESNDFILGNTIMPTLPNERENDRADIIKILDNQSESIKKDLNLSNEKLYPEDIDEICIDITGDGDNSYLLSGEKSADGKRIFKYSRSQKFIRDIILDALLSFQSVPTGSIHWFPVTYEQYCQLVNNNNQYPNYYYALDDAGKMIKDKPCDPMIRDYLLCDGRKYKSEEFPELAKILIKANITYWDNDGCRRSHKNSNSNKDGDFDDYFRVPDLRAKFISYCYTEGVKDALTQETAYLSNFAFSDTENNWSTGKEGWNSTGRYSPDNSPKRPSGQTGEHFHFIAYGTYNSYNKNGGPYGNGNELYNFTAGYSFEENPFSQSPSMWYLWNNPTNHSDWDGIGGYAYGFGGSGDRRRSQSSHDIITAWAFSSAPGGGYTNFKPSPSIGLTSKSQMIYQIPESNDETYKITKYESMDDYVPLEEGISQATSNKDMKHRYGHENAPKFYAFLPLIKI